MRSTPIHIAEQESFSTLFANSRSVEGIIGQDLVLNVSDGWQLEDDVQVTWEIVYDTDPFEVMAEIVLQVLVKLRRGIVDDDRFPGFRPLFETFHIMVESNPRDHIFKVKAKVQLKRMGR